MKYRGMFDQIDSAVIRLSEATMKMILHRRMLRYELPIQQLIVKLFNAQGIAYAAAFRRRSSMLREANISMLREANDPALDWVTLFEQVDGVIATRFNKRITTVLQRTYANSARDAIRDYALQVSFDLKNPRAVQYAQDRATELLRELNETTRQEIKALIVEMIDRGESPSSVARKISSRFADYVKRPPMGKHLRNRAELVAVTEAAHAYQTANYQLIKSASDTGLKFEKYWLTVGDARVSQGCLNNAAEDYIGLDETFSSGHLTPPRFPGCRCSAIYRRS